MKKISTLLMCLCLGLAASAVHAKRSGGTSGGSHGVNGYTKRDGTYVQPHHSTNPNHTQRDNWTSKPNVNPYNGKQGTKEPSH